MVMKFLKKNFAINFERIECICVNPTQHEKRFAPFQSNIKNLVEDN